MARPKTHDDDLRRQLLERTAATVHAYGVDTLSMRQLAADAGTSTSAVYTLFGGKEQLLEAVVVASFSSFTAAQNAVAAGFMDGPAAGELAALGREYRRWALANPVLFSLMFSGALNAYVRSPETLACAADGLAPLMDAVRRGQASGALRGEPAELIATSLWGIVHGLASLELAGMGPDGTDWNPVYEAALAASIRGWRT
ncbi:TetR/AcrR family transcriptional regulator [Pseudarthrobacter sp. P1]|uniref:TetR/AcrR family transcriptional regulator n=1 Tax=Pseudarthrobacter sp. P1 TaxID=3418418 RepID=UPI003CF3897A